MQTEIKKITDKIVTEYKPEKIILFGSFAWGKPYKDSDVDLFIVKKTRKPKLHRTRELRSLLFGNNFPALDLLVYTPIEMKRRGDIGYPFIKEIIDKGQLLYAK